MGSLHRTWSVPRYWLGAVGPCQPLAVPAHMLTLIFPLTFPGNGQSPKSSVFQGFV